MTTYIVDLNELEDIIPLNLLSDFDVKAYRPLGTVMLAISQPASLCVLHEDIVSCLELVMRFIREILERGIPKSVFYIHSHGLRNDMRNDMITKRYPTILMASDLRDAIKNDMPGYGMRPAVSVFLYEANKGKAFFITSPSRSWWMTAGATRSLLIGHQNIFERAFSMSLGLKVRLRTSNRMNE
ncbi:hypothetical protein DAPPUDRAFT_118033 [Daphnia pulex]|uniref:Uncharacterized protein n=1 Tax=Daphnia pulex TaxID=6669 RepID=E9HUI2_DAPPU|nr:hypothetical protein DAPPUDRAFT_118033 [Daphnia pulex]|eukprot:EFX64583.1 hypothetical protein DAPPUDRAFT_118033 [Daphnia pulex]